MKITRIETLEELALRPPAHGYRSHWARQGLAELSVHTPLNAETRGFISAEAFAAAKSGLVLINTARGPIIDLDALAEAMRGCRLADAGLDLLPTKEPPILDIP